MFADSLLDTRVGSHQGLTTLASFGLQGIALCGVLLLPLIYTQGLPQLFTTHPEISLAPPPGPPPSERIQRASHAAPSNMDGVHVVAPDHVPSSVARIVDNQEPPPVSIATGWVDGGPPGNGPRDGILNSIGNSFSRGLPPPPPSPPQHAPRISHMMEGNLIYQVQPTYPPAARAARIQGPVVIKAVISRDGAIENLKVISGHPFLVKAALDAVSQWRYRPYILNGEAVEVETQVTVNFILSGQ